MTTGLALRALDVIVTSDCNLRCGYCYQNAKAPGRLAWPTLRAGLDLVLRSTARNPRVTFIGGEPLLEFPLVRRAVGYIEARAPAYRPVRFAMSTNGLLLGDVEAEFLARHRFSVQLSFDGVPPAQDARGRGTFSHLDGLLVRLRRSHPALFVRRLSVALTLTRRNLPHLARSIAYFLDKGLFDIVVAPALRTGSEWTRRDVDLLDRQFARVADACGEHAAAWGFQPVRNLRPMRPHARGASVPDALCGVARGEVLALDIDGQLSGCLLFARSYQRFPANSLGRGVERLLLGAVTGPSLRRRVARYAEKTAAIGIFDRRSAKRSSYAACARCSCRHDCFICPMSIVFQEGNTDPDRVPDFACAFNRVTAKYRRLLARADAAVRRPRALPPVPAHVRALAEQHGAVALAE